MEDRPMDVWGAHCPAACQTNTSVETSIEATLDRLQHEDCTNAILAIGSRP